MTPSVSRDRAMALLALGSELLATDALGSAAPVALPAALDATTRCELLLGAVALWRMDSLLAPSHAAVQRELRHQQQEPPPDPAQGRAMLAALSGCGFHHRGALLLRPLLMTPGPCRALLQRHLQGFSPEAATLLSALRLPRHLRSENLALGFWQLLARMAQLPIHLGPQAWHQPDGQVLEGLPYTGVSHLVTQLLQAHPGALPPARAAQLVQAFEGLLGFDPLNYLASHQDLIEVLGDDTEAATSHYIRQGHAEGRLLHFDPAAYLALHPSLQDRVGQDLSALSRHFIGQRRRPAVAAEARRAAPAGTSAAVDWVQQRQRAQLIGQCRPPRHYYIDLGNHCNLRCPYCVTGARTNSAPGGFMRASEYRVILDKIADHAELVALYNWGEPLLNRELVDIIAMTAARGIKVHIDSNLSTHDFSDEQADRLVGSGLHSLFASIDGVTQAVYEKYRVRGKLARVLRNLRQLVQARARLGLGLNKPLLGWQFHVSAYNEHEMPAARELAREIGVPIVFKRLSSPDADWWSSLHEQAQMVLDGGDWFNAAYAPAENPQLRHTPLHPRVVNPCKQLFGTMTVAWNGDVMPCTTVEGPAFAMGNLLRDSLEAVWNGAPFQGCRRFILDYGPPQQGGSVCELGLCALQEKSVGAPNRLPPVVAGG